VRIINSIRDFIIYWRDYSGRPLEKMFHGWLMSYILRYPELLIFEVSYWQGLDRPSLGSPRSSSDSMK
jgi:hypothetical protein